MSLQRPHAASACVGHSLSPSSVVRLSCGSNTSNQRDFLVTGHKYGHTRHPLRL
ncbi:unnamed protein product [Ectocarpus sp. 13 AM-2016]